MECFCISLRLSRSSQLKLYETCNLFDISADNRNFFYHTTLLQGIVESYNSIYSSKIFQEYLESIREAFRSLLYAWDEYVKSSENISFLKFDNIYDVCVLNYTNSDCIMGISREFDLFFKTNQLYSFSSNYNFKENNLNKNNFKYAFNFPYKARYYNFQPHTTLGYIENNNISNRAAKILDRLNYTKFNSLIHDAVVLSRLDEHCMTPISESQLLLDLR